MQAWRWWDGRAWTNQTAPLDQPVPATWAERPKLDPAVPVYNVFIWLTVLLPVIAHPFSLLYRPHITFETIGPEHEKAIDPLSMFTPSCFVLVGVGLLVYVAGAVLSYLDSRRLKRNGVVRPFAWGWSFLSSIIFVIGRSVIVHSVAPKRGLWPVWVAIVVTVLGLVTGSIIEARLFQQMSSS
jgi:hypothetical protein